MTLSGLRMLSALLLPALLLRGLLPAGYMLDTHDEQLRIVLCSEGLDARQDQGKDGDDSPPAGSPDCPFAHFPGSAPPPSPATTRVAALGLPFLQPASAINLAIAGPPRATTARAPPFFSAA